MSCGPGSLGRPGALAAALTLTNGLNAADGLWHEITTSGTAAPAPAAGSTSSSGGGYGY